ncbi:AAA family ATPase [bacterium]|nr:AAA family ATPase [bacterium]
MKGISEYLELNEIARKDGASYENHRQIYHQISIQEGRHLIGIVGPIGVGKTVLLKQLAHSHKNSFYLSVDTMSGEDLFQIASVLSDQYKIKTLLLDEIHYKRDYQKELKKIYDFLSIRVVFTSSVSLSLKESAF